MEMALDETLEHGKVYRSPVDFLEDAEGELPEDQEYWLENSTGEEWVFDSLPELRNFLETKEDDWGKYRDFLPVESDSESIQVRESDEAKYFGIEFPYMELETDYNQGLAGQTGKLSLGYLTEKEVIDGTVEKPTLRPADD